MLIGVALRQSLSEDLTVLSLPLGSLVVFLVIAVVFGVLAAIVPAIRASRMKVLDGDRDGVAAAREAAHPFGTPGADTPGERWHGEEVSDLQQNTHGSGAQ